MLKKILLFIVTSCVLLLFAQYTHGACNYGGGGAGTDGIVSALEGCFSDSPLVGKGTDLEVTTGFKEIILEWIKKLAGFLALGAVFSIAFGSLKLVLSGGEEDKIKKAKDIIKWGLLGFIGIISAGLLIALVVNIMYSIGG